MAKCEIYVRDLKGRVHFCSIAQSEIYRQKGWRVLHDRPALNLDALNKGITDKIREVSLND